MCLGCVECREMTTIVTVVRTDLWNSWNLCLKVTRVNNLLSSVCIVYHLLPRDSLKRTIFGNFLILWTHVFLRHVLDRCPLFWASSRTLQRSRILCPLAGRVECACKPARILNAQSNFYYIYTHNMLIETMNEFHFVKLWYLIQIKYGDQLPGDGQIFFCLVGFISLSLPVLYYITPVTRASADCYL